MTAAALVADLVLVLDNFWDHPRSSAEMRAYLRQVLLDEGHRRLEGRLPRSPADILAVVDELVAQVRREEQARRWAR